MPVCPKVQALKVALGGTLEQHPHAVSTRLTGGVRLTKTTPAHIVRSKSWTLFGAPSLRNTDVNSSHHQGLDVVADPLEEIAWAEDGVLEAVVSSEHPWAVGVQWHPEAMAPEDRKQLGLFRAFVEATRKFRQNRLARSA